MNFCIGIFITLLGVISISKTISAPATPVSLHYTQLSDTFFIFTKTQDEIAYANAFAVLNIAQNPQLPYMTCFIDNTKMIPLHYPDPHFVTQLQEQMIEIVGQPSIEISYHIYRMPFLSEAKNYTMRIAASASVDSKDDSVFFSIPLHVDQIHVSSLFRVNYPIARIQKEVVIQLEGKNLEWDDHI